MLAVLTTGWGRAVAGLILASVMPAGIVTFGALQRQAGRQDPDRAFEVTPKRMTIWREFAIDCLAFR